MAGNNFLVWRNKCIFKPVYRTSNLITIFMLGLAHVLVILAIGFLLVKKENPRFQIIFGSALTFKLMAGVALGLLYMWFYTTGDTFTYFHDAQVLGELARHNFASYISFLWDSDASNSIWNKLYYQQPRALFLSKIASAVGMVVGDNYWIIAGYFSLISFISAWFLVKEINRWYPQAGVAAVISFLFFPSVVFWTSGLIKESLAMACVFFLSIIFLRTWNRSSLTLLQWILFPIALWIGWNLKYYYLAVFIPIAATSLVVKRWIVPYLKLTNPFIQTTVWIIIFLIPLFVVSRIHPNFYPGRILNVIVDNYNAFIFLSHPDYLIHYPNLEPAVSSMAIHAPKALVSVLFRPFLWEASNLPQSLLALENTGLLVLMVVALAKFKSIIHSPQKMLWLPMLVYIILLGVFLALSTPNLGTLSRYRVGFLPFLVLLILYNNPLIIRWTKKALVT